MIRGGDAASWNNCQTSGWPFSAGYATYAFIKTGIHVLDDD
jgi:hypothetical protein